MKKKILLIAIPLILLALIAGAYFLFSFSDSQTETSKVQNETVADENDADKPADTNTPGTVQPSPQFQFAPFMDKLSDSEKELYLEMRTALYSYQSYTIDLDDSQYTEDDFTTAFDALCADNPILDLYISTEYICNDDSSTSSIKVYPTLSIIDNEYDFDEFDPEIMDAYIADINAVCDEIISRMPQDTSIAEKYEFLGREICYMTEYSHDDMLYNSYAEEYATVRLDGALLYGKSVCISYSQAYQYLCNRAGLWCIVTEGFAEEGHAWNLVMLEDGLTYHVDLTWADIDDGEYYSDYFYNYFLLTQEEIEIDHVHEDKDEWCATGIKY